MRRRPHLISVVAVIAFIVALTAAIVVYRHNDPVADAGQTPGYSAPAPVVPSSMAASRSVGTSRSESSSVAPPSSSTASPGVVFLGDNYTLGIGASSKAQSWTALVTHELRLSGTVVGADGAGYAKRSPEGQDYQSLIGQVVAARPALVLISGGRNDVGDDTGTVKQHARTLFAALHQALPDAVLVALAPWWGDSPHPAELAAVAGAVKHAAERTGATYLDPGDPLVGHPSWMADDANPDDRGYQAIAASVAPIIKRRLPR